METYIQISKLNDYLFCPKSLYLHTIYENFSETTYHSYKQTVGKMSHNSIDSGTYSTQKDILQGTPIFSHKYNLMGKIDIFNQKTGELIERKYQIKKIYDGYLLQVYAQYICLKEMGFKITKISLYSMVDNKKYNIPIPKQKDLLLFQNTITKIYNQDINLLNVKQNINKCNNCIYHSLCNI